jgi:hypothetical protein
MDFELLEPQAPVLQIYVTKLPHEITLEQDFLQWRQEIKNSPEVTDLHVQMDATLGDLKANRVHHKIVNQFVPTLFITHIFEFLSNSNSLRKETYSF